MELERENYMVTGKYGHKHIPGRPVVRSGVFFIVGFGIFWTVMGAAMTVFGGGVFGIVPCFGVLFVLLVQASVLRRS